MEEMRLKKIGSPDLPDFRVDLLSEGNSFVYSRENSFEIFGTPVKTCLICENVLEIFGSRNCFKSDLLRPWSFANLSLK